MISELAYLDVIEYKLVLGDGIGAGPGIGPEIGQADIGSDSEPVVEPGEVVSGDQYGTHNRDLCGISDKIESSSTPTQSVLASRLHTDVNLHLKQFKFTDIPGHRTGANTRDLHDDFGHITSIDSNILQVGFISVIHDE